ncbi:histidine phosphatase superfamily [Penicillium cinerascens]|uniref:Histidine phosphatase superfamily n=1 Tax=Penicillium cinerascens TaxID=70096 RepID=A0A9W9MA74_9EURO|nr:histidine phosphatase superfamily [Penicillium cinerascens]KAJ5195566.1 histidine phosphatase superfamily [Penicillium cinerascens]
MGDSEVKNSLVDASVYLLWATAPRPSGRWTDIRSIQFQNTDTSQDSENFAWVQSSSDCSKVTVSSNNYYLSHSYRSMLASTASQTLANL